MEQNNFSDISNNSSRRNSERRRVSFPETELVTYAEPTNPLKLAQNVTVEQVRTAYLLNCIKYKTNPLRNVLDQIMRLELDNNRESSFEIRGEIITSDMCETFEEIFRRVQFSELNLINCMISDDAAAALFDMIEYYETATRFKMNISFGIESRGWDSFKRYLSKSQCLQNLELFSMDIKENEFALLVSPLSTNVHLETLKIRNCTLQSPVAMSCLAQKLQQNSTLRELYLPHNGLKEEDAAVLSNIVKNNNSIYLLDLSNNSICDKGAGYIFEALCGKTSQDRLLNVLILWNTNLTDNFAEPFKIFLKHNYKLEILNLGQNKIKDAGFLSFEKDLKENKSLVRLGVQKCELTDFSVMSAGRIILENNSLERIDFRGNNITLDGLKIFFENLEYSTTVLQADFDPYPSDNIYSAVLSNISQRCDANQVLKKNEATCAEESKRKKASRKISLTCQTLTTQRRSPPSSSLRTSSGRLRSPDLSPVPSPSASPRPTFTKNRFQITLVNESNQIGSQTISKASRFTVYNVKENTTKTTIGFNVPTTSSGMETSSNNGFHDSPREKPERTRIHNDSLEGYVSRQMSHGSSGMDEQGDGKCSDDSQDGDNKSGNDEIMLTNEIELSRLATEPIVKTDTLSVDSSQIEIITAKDSDNCSSVPHYVEPPTLPEIVVQQESLSSQLTKNTDSKSINNEYQSAFENIETELSDNCKEDDIGTINSEFYVISVSEDTIKENENINDCVENKLDRLKDDSVDLKNNNKLETKSK